MRFVPLQSSNLTGIAYDQSNEHLYAQFVNGGVYKYSYVPGDVVLSVIFDPISQAKAFTAKIKNGDFPFEKVTDLEGLGLHV